MAVADFDSAVRPAAAGYAASFAYRVARLYQIGGLTIDHRPGSRPDFAQALQLLGARPGVVRLMRGHTHRVAMKVHVSCSRSDWEKVFGDVECCEEVLDSRPGGIWHRWKHFCTDGPVTCRGYLFQRQPGLRWMVVVQVCRG